jgi:hypothetical protein
MRLMARGGCHQLRNARRAESLREKSLAGGPVKSGRQRRAAPAGPGFRRSSPDWVLGPPYKEREPAYPVPAADQSKREIASTAGSVVAFMRVLGSQTRTQAGSEPNNDDHG